jgi:tungstate transport system substrate-binding protein
VKRLADAGRAVLLSCLMVASLAGCGREEQKAALPIATTTSIAGSGLLDVLAREFKLDSGIELRAFVVGSGQAIQLAKRNEVDLIITHDPDAERAFVAERKPLLYRQFMWNDFILVGPPGDSAGVARAQTAADAFARIAASKSRFCSRGDQSGTHTKELRMWAAAGADPGRNPNYLSMGQPMAHLLRSAGELQAYALTDRATFDRVGGSTGLRPLFSGDPQLRNVYAITVTGADQGQAAQAQAFCRWLLEGRGMKVIQDFRIRGSREFWLLSEKQQSHSATPAQN